MDGPAYYNEIDPFAAEMLRNLINAGHIAPGFVDQRSIEDVSPIELLEYRQCHFFAGVGVWSLALRKAGWPDDRPVWTGSCPCQPFSAAGKGDGFADERHLWPAFNHLISQRRPPTVFGEQVASKDADPWIDLVHTDLEAMGYAFGAVPFPSASIGAPHIRDRLYWVADANQRAGRQRSTHVRGWIDRGDAQSWARPCGGSMLDRLDHADDTGLEGHGRGHRTEIGQRQGEVRPVGPASESGRLADAAHSGRIKDGKCATPPWCDGAAGNDGTTAQQPTAGPTNGFWRDADWLLCRDGKWRPVESGTFPLAHGAPSRVGRLRAYGNAINAIQAQIFIEAHLRALSGAETKPMEA